MIRLAASYGSASSASTRDGAMATSSMATSGPGPGSASTRAVTAASRPSASTTTSQGPRFGAACSRRPRSSRLCRGHGRWTPCAEYRHVGGALRPPRCASSDVELGSDVLLRDAGMRRAATKPSVPGRRRGPFPSSPQGRGPRSARPNRRASRARLRPPRSAGAGTAFAQIPPEPAHHRSLELLTRARRGSLRCCFPTLTHRVRRRHGVLHGQRGRPSTS